MNTSHLPRILGPLVGAFFFCAASLGAERTAGAQVVEVAPPALRVEVAPIRPSPRHVWNPGYWAWEPTGYVWYGGRWEIERPGWHWAGAHWVREGRRWHFVRGHYWR